MEMDSDLITLEELAVMLHRNVNTLRVAVSNRPESLPPRVRFPGVQRNYWRRSTVDKWIVSFEEPFDPVQRSEPSVDDREMPLARNTDAGEVSRKNRVGRPTKAEQMRRRGVA